MIEDIYKNKEKLEKAQEVFKYNMRGRDKEKADSVAKTQNIDSSFDYFVKETLVSDEVLDAYYKVMMDSKEKENRYRDMIRENMDFLKKSKIDDYTIQDSLDEKTPNYPNMKNKIEELLFCMYTLSCFDELFENMYITKISPITGDYDEDIYGFKFTTNQEEEYSIVIDNEKCSNKISGKTLVYGESEDNQLLNDELSVLSNFDDFSNADAILIKRIELEKRLGITSESTDIEDFVID